MIAHPKVEEHILKLSQHQQNLIVPVIGLIRTTPVQLIEDYKFRIPFYYFNGPLCYLTFPAKHKHLAIGFMKGTRMEATKPLLIGNQKLVRHLEIHSLYDNWEEDVIRCLDEAIELNTKR
jgi:hypothetical protein